MLKFGKYEICFLDLFTDQNGKISSAKIWFHVANLIMSRVMLTQGDIGWELLAAYGAICGGSHVATVWLKSKYGVTNADLDNK